MLKRIKESPTPDWVKKLQRWAKTTDDIQDFIVTAEVAGKLAVRAAKRWAPKLAAKVLGRAIPGLGWVLLANDALNLATTILSLPSGASGAKRIAEAILGSKLKNLKGRYKFAKKIGELSTTWREWIQVAQASEEITGVGLRLGAVMGFLSDCFWGIWKGAELHGPWEKPGTLENKAYKALKSIWEQGEHVKWLGSDALARNAMAMDVAYDILYGQSLANNWPATANANRHRKVPTKDEIRPKWYGAARSPIPIYYEPKQVIDPISIQVLKDMGLDPEEDVGFIGYPYGEAPTLGEIIDAPMETEGQRLINAIMHHYDHWHARLAHDAITKIGDSWDKIFAAEPGEREDIWDEWGGAAIRTFTYRLYPPKGTSIDDINAAWTEIGAKIKLKGRFPTFDEAYEICSSTWGGVCRRLPCW